MEKSLKISVILSAIDKMSKVIGEGVDKSVKKLDTLRKNSDAMSRAFIENGKSTAMVGLAIAAPLGLAVKAAADYERMNIALKTSFQGNEAASKKAFSAINDFAAKTPYELEEVMRGFIKLKNMGLDPSEKALTAYGNVASGMGKSLNDMVEAVADAATGEFERLKEFGIKAKSKGDEVAFTFQGVTTKVKKNSAEIEKYLKNIGNTKFAGGIDAQSKSLHGQISTLKDSVKMFAANIGMMLIPVLKDLMAKVGPVMARIQKWTQDNPRLTKTIVMGAAALAALILVVSACQFAMGGLFKVISFGSTVMKVGTAAFGMLSGGITGATISFKAMDTAMKANVIILIISLIAGLALLIYNNWASIKKFFIDLWDGVKNAFKKAWDWIINLPFMKPVKLIIDNWGKIKNFFSDLWTNVKQKFVDFFVWIDGIPKRMYNAGANIIKSIWEGIKSFINKPIEAIKGMVTKIREYLPFSPAKVGPLKDIHKTKIVETIAESIKPGPIVKAMNSTTAAAMNVSSGGASGSRSAGAIAPSGGGGGGITINYKPQITISGGADAQSFERELKKHERQLLKVIEEAQRKAGRTKF
jgi:phage-related minor tail protein